MVDHTEETERGCQLPSTLDMGSKTSQFCLAPFVFPCSHALAEIWQQVNLGLALSLFVMFTHGTMRTSTGQCELGYTSTKCGVISFYLTKRS